MTNARARLCVSHVTIFILQVWRTQTRSGPDRVVAQARALREPEEIRASGPSGCIRRAIQPATRQSHRVKGGTCSRRTRARSRLRDPRVWSWRSRGYAALHRDHASGLRCRTLHHDRFQWLDCCRLSRWYSAGEQRHDLHLETDIRTLTPVRVAVARLQRWNPAIRIVLDRRRS
jgi:hypothetical protein